jgi:hypothetical protein
MGATDWRASASHFSFRVAVAPQRVADGKIAQRVDSVDANGGPEKTTSCVPGMGAELAAKPETRECSRQLGFICGTPV